MVRCSCTCVYWIGLFTLVRCVFILGRSWCSTRRGEIIVTGKLSGCTVVGRSFRFVGLPPPPTKSLHEKRYQNENVRPFFASLNTPLPRKISARTFIVNSPLITREGLNVSSSLQCGRTLMVPLDDCRLFVLFLGMISLIKSGFETKRRNVDVRLCDANAGAFFYSLYFTS